MKLISALLPALLFTQITFSQKIDSASMVHLSEIQKVKVNEYLRKATVAKHVALGLSLGGLILVLIGGIIREIDYSKRNVYQPYENPPVSKGLAIAGAVTGTTGLPFIFKVHIMRNKARAIVFGK